MPRTPIKVTTFTLGEFQTNCFALSADGAEHCWLVDCGYEPDPMLDWVERQGLTVAGLLLTHCHSDHIAGIDLALSRLGPFPISVHEAEAAYCADPMLNLSALLGAPVSVTAPDRVLHGGDTLDLLGTLWRVIHTPGHSPGGVTFIHDESAQAIVGDTLFAGSIGRFDFPTSNVADLRRTVADVLMTLPDETTIHPGHGPATTIGDERRTNPFVVGGF